MSEPTSGAAGGSDPVRGERRYAVSGMTCAHCVAAVTEEVTALPGVKSVTVSLEQGTVSVTGDGVHDEAVRAAVAEAGYAVV